jgi:predicted nucleic acid-binding protein
MTYLADANLICEQTKSLASARAVQWLEAHAEDFVIDAVVLGEIWDGIASLTDGRKKQDLEGWFARLRRSVTCLPWTGDTAVVWGRPEASGASAWIHRGHQGHDDRRHGKAPRIDRRHAKCG